MFKFNARAIVACISGLMMGVFVSLPASAGSMLVDCAPDIAKYCDQVTLGNGRLMACMYAHEDKLSDACDASIDETADQLDWFFDTLNQAITTCSGDIEKFCSGVEFGEGRVYLCLGEKIDSLTPECKMVVEKVDERLIN